MTSDSGTLSPDSLELFHDSINGRVRVVGVGMPTPRMCGKRWQDVQLRPITANDLPCVCAGQANLSDDDRLRPVSVPRFPWYY